MPNHIKNRITLKGEEEVVKNLIETYSTFYPSVPGKSHSGDTRYKNDKDEYGFLNKDTNEFFRRGQEIVIGVPSGYEVDMEPEWTRFPDFEKIHPIPEVIKNVGNIHHGIIDAVKAKYQAKMSYHPLVAMLQAKSRLNAKDSFEKPEEQKSFELACKAYEETGYCYWYDYQVDKWGTKWNAYSCEKESENVFEFETAWSSPVNLIHELAKSFPDIVIELKYADEDTGSNTGIYEFKGEEILKEYLPENGSNLAYELAFDLRPDYKEDYYLVNGKYEYHDKD